MPERTASLAAVSFRHTLQHERPSPNDHNDVYKALLPGSNDVRPSSTVKPTAIKLHDIERVDKHLNI